MALWESGTGAQFLPACPSTSASQYRALGSGLALMGIVKRCHWSRQWWQEQGQAPLELRRAQEKLELAPGS